MAAFNAWMNRTAYNAAAQLSDEQRKGDRVWRSRVGGMRWSAGRAGGGLHEDFSALLAAQCATDDEISAWAARLDFAQLAGTLTGFSAIAQRARR